MTEQVTISVYDEFVHFNAGKADNKCPTETRGAFPASQDSFQPNPERPSL